MGVEGCAVPSPHVKVRTGVIVKVRFDSDFDQFHPGKKYHCPSDPRQSVGGGKFLQIRRRRRGPLLKTTALRGNWFLATPS